MSTVDEALTLAQQATQAGDLDRAAYVYRQILEAVPEQPNALHGLGILAYQAGRFDEAERQLRRALAVCPDDPRIHNNLHLALRSQGRTAEAVDCCRKALELAPDAPEFHNNLGIALKETGAVEEAVECFRQAIGLQADYGNAHYNLANTLLKLCRLDEAERTYRRGVELQPSDWQAHTNLGTLLQLQGRYSEAMACFETALAHNAQSDETRYCRAMLRLLLGRFSEAWSDYERRWQIASFIFPNYRQPVWRGQPLEGRTILLWAEQGVGDTIQFVRYASLVKQRGAARVLLECPTRWHAVLGQAPHIDRLVAPGHSEPFDYYTALLSLPAAMNTTLETIPWPGAYLSADAGRVAYWRRQLEHLEGFKVGIVWQGNPNFLNDAYRSVPLAKFEPLARCRGVTLVSLQKGTGAEQLAPLAQRFGIVEPGPQFDAGSDAFVDTAAVMMNLDLVISSDTSVAHLAGALGVPVWLALQLAPAWYWMLERSDSPWYPSMRLFRQSRLDGWDDVFAEMAARLESLLARRGVS